MNKLKGKFIFLVKILIPVVLLAVIFSRVDLGAVIRQIINVHPGYFGLSLLVGFGFQITGGAWRWHYFLKHVYGLNFPYIWILKHYWKGMFLGYFAPGHLGWDAYRIIVANQKENRPLVHVTAVILEKFIGLFSCLILIMVSYPFVADKIVHGEKILAYVNYIYLLAIIVGICAVAAFFMKRVSATLIGNLEAKIVQMSFKFLKNSAPPADQSVLLQGIRACCTPRTAAALWGSSIFIRSCSALGGYLVLLALYQDTSVMINFFVVPMMLFLTMVPVSLGGIGIREGVFIILYGLFGISSTTSLSASYLGLIGLLLTVSIGGFIMLWDNVRKEKNLE